MNEALEIVLAELAHLATGNGDNQIPASKLWGAIDVLREIKQSLLEGKGARAPNTNQKTKGNYD